MVELTELVTLNQCNLVISILKDENGTHLKQKKIKLTIKLAINCWSWQTSSVKGILQLLNIRNDWTFEYVNC